MEIVTNLSELQVKTRYIKVKHEGLESKRRVNGKPHNMEINMTNMTVNGIMFQILNVFCQIIKTQIKCFSRKKTMKMKVSKTKSCPKKLIFEECRKLLVQQVSK